jgi:hypothetical protein
MPEPSDAAQRFWLGRAVAKLDGQHHPTHGPACAALLGALDRPTDEDATTWWLSVAEVAMARHHDVVHGSAELALRAAHQRVLAGRPLTDDPTDDDEPPEPAGYTAAGPRISQAPPLQTCNRCNTYGGRHAHWCPCAHTA